MIELLITITILAILTAVGVPAFSSFVASQRVKTASFDIMSTLMLARSEALKRNINVTITPTSSSNWANGWSISDGTTTLSQQSALKNLTITGPANVTYNNSGRLATAAATFAISSAISMSGLTPRCVSVDLSGRPNSKVGTC